MIFRLRVKLHARRERNQSFRQISFRFRDSPHYDHLRYELTTCFCATKAVFMQSDKSFFTRGIKKPLKSY